MTGKTMTQEPSGGPSGRPSRRPFAKGLLAVMIGMLIPVLVHKARAQDVPSLRLASTTSTENSGLLAELLPQFTRQTGIRVHVIAVGTGQALQLGQRGDVDVVLVHHRPSEQAFIRKGFGIDRRDVMYNDFVLIGPKANPAAIDPKASVRQALTMIAKQRRPFVSRGDNSGTHKQELALWQAAGLAPWKKRPGWYRAVGTGMGASLNIAAAMGAYILSDRATWRRFRNRSGLRILVEGDPRLFNQYGVMIVAPKRHPHVRLAAARRFLDWLTGPVGQRAINRFRIAGQQVFFAGKAPAPEN